jgi:hypothetical protein
MVYFLLGEKTRLIKIGKTIKSNVFARMDSFKLHSPDKLGLLGIISNAEGAEEKKIHIKFACLRDHGEWFRESEELLKFIKIHCDITIEDLRAARSKRLPKAKSKSLDYKVEECKDIVPISSRFLSSRIEISQNKINSYKRQIEKLELSISTLKKQDIDIQRMKNVG